MANLQNAGVEFYLGEALLPARCTFEIATLPFLKAENRKKHYPG
jgi:hypothetical protein